MMIFIASFTASTGKSFGKSGLVESMSIHRLMTRMACLESILVYTNSASVVNRNALGGRSEMGRRASSRWEVLQTLVGM